MSENATCRAAERFLEYQTLNRRSGGTGMTLLEEIQAELIARKSHIAAKETGGLVVLFDPRDNRNSLEFLVPENWRDKEKKENGEEGDEHLAKVMARLPK